MAETSAGGWVRSAAESAASRRPWASVSGEGSAANGSASASTRESASATGISATASLLCPIMPRPSAALLEQADALDAHATLERLDHVVDGQAGDGDRGQRFHLDPGRPSDFDAGAHPEAGRLAFGLNVDSNVRDGEAMTEPDQLMRALCRHDAGDAGSAEHVALLRVACEHQVERLWRHHDAALRYGLALARHLRRHVDHARLAASTQMAQLGRAHHRFTPRRRPGAPRERAHASQ